MNYLLTVAYDGAPFCGWQTQKNGLAVQEVLENALSSLLRKKIAVTGASRTDAGVHAVGQRAMFCAEDFNIPLDKLPYAVNAHLPPTVAVTSAEAVADDFNPIFCAKRKTYVYRIYCAKFRNPLAPKNALYINHNLDIAKMRKAALCFVGTHDFAAFKAAGSSAKTSVRTIFELAVTENDGNIEIKICGNGFLYNMVRILAGTLVYAAEGKINVRDIPNVILSKNRELAGKTLPPNGLTLVQIDY